MTATAPLAPGDTIHAVATGLTLATSCSEMLACGEILRRGQNLSITQTLLDANRDREGRSVLDLVDDEAAQVARWGRVMFARGPAPDGLSWWVPGSPEHYEAREQARKGAWAMPDADARAEALARVEAIYGPAPTSSRTLGSYAGSADPREP